MKYPFVKQTDLKDCGICSLLMIMKYYRGGVSKEYLRKITKTSKDGVSAYNLVEASKKVGFASYGAEGKIKDIDHKLLPCIAHVVINKSYKHFVVIYHIDRKKKKLIVADPAKGIKKMKVEELEEISTGKFIFLSPVKKIQLVENNKCFHNLLYSFFLSNKKSILFLLLFSIIITLFSIFYSFLFQFLMDYVMAYQSFKNLLVLALLFFGVIIIKEISQYQRNVVLNHITHHLDKHLTTNVYNHMISLPYLYYRTRTTGEVIARMNDLSNIRDTFSKIIITIGIDSILASIVLVTLLLLNVKLTMILVITILILFIIILIFKRVLEKQILISKEHASHLNSFLVETLSGVETIKNLNIEPYVKKNFLLNYCKYNEKSYSYNKIYIIEQFLKDFIDEIGAFLVMIIGSILVSKNTMTLAELITYITLMGYLLTPVKNILELELSWKDAKISLNRIIELYEVDDEKLNTNEKKQAQPVLGTIKTNSLSYSYNDKDFILNDINLDIKTGEKVLIYGSSGSGKSTLAKILSKQLTIKNKQVYIDNKDMNQYNTDDLRKNICYVSQTETLFTDSIHQNIVLDNHTDYNTFLDTSKLCMVDDFVEDNLLAYDTLLEENGFNLSGGQRQRIILARAIIKNTPVYIFDESLNEIDVERERIILKDLFKKYQNKTIIVVSHRFNNSDLFEKKYRIENGVSYEE